MADTIDHLGVQHIGVPVDDLSATRAFYLDILGFRPLPRPGDRPENDSGIGGAWFDLGNGQMLHLAERMNDPRIPIQHFALSVTDVAAIAADLRTRGAEVREREYRPGYGRQAFVRDPSGNIIELNELDSPARGCELPVRPVEETDVERRARTLPAYTALTTTRAVRRKLDLARPVDPEIIRECVRIALHAPNGSNLQDFRFVVVTDPDQRRELARLYAEGLSGYGDEGSDSRAHLKGAPPEAVAAFERIKRSAGFLAAHLHEVPVLVVPCVTWRIPTPDTLRQASMYGSVLPPVWSFMLACRMYRLGTAWTTGHLTYEKEAADLLRIPIETVTQVALIPVAHVRDDPFRPGPRRPVDDFVRWNHW
jgi:nitroreductase/catechol 2,3-dioxygenase-like lactoylglutathione lyase family enzyme